MENRTPLKKPRKPKKPKKQMERVKIEARKEEEDNVKMKKKKDLIHMTVPELREECGRRKLKVSEGGKPLRKAALIVRIATADKGQTSLANMRQMYGRGGAKPGPQHGVESSGGADPKPVKDETEAVSAAATAVEAKECECDWEAIPVTATAVGHGSSDGSGGHKPGGKDEGAGWRGAGPEPKVGA